MTRVIRISAVLFAGLLMAGCAMPAEGMMAKRKSSYNPPEQQVVYSNEASQEFIDGVGDLALDLLTSDAIAKVSQPPLIVIRPLETEGEVPFDTAKYAEAERNILIGKAGNKISFIDKETTVEANYYLYGVISAAAAPPSANPGGRRRYSIRSAPVGAHSHCGVQAAPNSLPHTPTRLNGAVGQVHWFGNLAQAAEGGQGQAGNKSFRFTLTLVDPHANAILWKDECGFTPREIPRNKQRYK